MCKAVPPLPQYAFLEWCSVRGSTGTTLLLPFYLTVIGNARRVRVLFGCSCTSHTHLTDGWRVRTEFGSASWKFDGAFATKHLKLSNSDESSVSLTSV
jgi:hypothetical protein